MTPLGPASLLLAYLIGAIPFGYLLVKLKKGADIRRTGSGGTGATNVTRSLGPAWGLLTLALDTGKGYAAMELAAHLTGSDVRWLAPAAVAAIAGHSYPVLLRFRGGKGVATAVGAFIHFTPLALLPVLGVWLLVLLIWRYVSLASVLATAAYPLSAMALHRPPLVVTLGVVAGACLIIFRHRSNLERLARGTEPKLRWKRKP